MFGAENDQSLECTKSFVSVKDDQCHHCWSYCAFLTGSISPSRVQRTAPHLHKPYGGCSSLWPCMIMIISSPSNGVLGSEPSRPSQDSEACVRPAAASLIRDIWKHLCASPKRVRSPRTGECQSTQAYTAGHLSTAPGWVFHCPSWGSHQVTAPPFSGKF